MQGADVPAVDGIEIETSSEVLVTRCQSPMVGDTPRRSRRASARGSVRPRRAPRRAAGTVAFSVPRSWPTSPQTVWLCTGVRWPGPQTKLTMLNRSGGIAVQQILGVGSDRAVAYSSASQPSSAIRSGSSRAGRARTMVSSAEPSDQFGHRPDEASEGSDLVDGGVRMVLFVSRCCAATTCARSGRGNPGAEQFPGTPARCTRRPSRRCGPRRWPSAEGEQRPHLAEVVTGQGKS